ncbi:siderochrome-iron transporter [Penicillium malachiteum]|uniref:siderochrome-iron transporter n=1 Tax=Penicillium malachiteum TaxID=1324776 RepID=UPI00254849B2|nr:siderochrome-iron transporter [Penicillium malachiteum]KAJ5730057.1 siderochrome-iron transporter [Penicillium malachiteum]
MERFITAVKRQFRPTPMQPSEPQSATRPDVESAGLETKSQDVSLEKGAVDTAVQAEAGASAIEATTAVWGKKGRWLVIAGIAMIMVTYELDNSTVYIYNNYSTSSFNALSKLAALSTAGSVLFAVIKPPIAKLSNVMGRGQTYMMTICLYILSYILMASAKTINTYAAGYIFYVMGQSGTNIMNDIVISDLSNARWRGFAIGVSFTPYLVTPWVSGFIVDSVVDGIGWRWGIGMFAILMPVGASFIITTLLYYQTRAKKMGLVIRQHMTIHDFCSQIDLGGVVLFSGGFALILVPLTLAATTTSKWKTPYVDALIAIGAVMLIVFPFYERLLSRYPFMPPSYFKNSTIALCLFLIATDSLGFECTHTYLYTWAIVARDFSARNATFYNSTNGVMQCLMGIIAGVCMMWTRRYKWLVIIGAVIRLIGYGIMIRLRGASNSLFELFFVQILQGIGSGIMQTNLLVPAQISVPHKQMPQITALVICFSFLGSSVGACIAGGIYTNTIKEALRNHLGDQASSALINELANSILDYAPAWGSSERIAVNLAFSDVLRYMTYTALASSVPAVILVWFMPNHQLPDRSNLVEEDVDR